MKKNKAKKQSGRVSLTLLFAVVIFCVLLIAILLALGWWCC